ncbi:hypothetical protein CTAYLR_000155 [Chrysophaeum taylorii]|uniref:30S ribosomal protein S13 n=1 Tax=Chrysophaeum taylorii TaxID=2483200 RepID=A0AAD7UGK8_9STRA|nr:hypothetical protein CTAYLR_000155 [Chrysophaeum taylorii]
MLRRTLARRVLFMNRDVDEKKSIRSVLTSFKGIGNALAEGYCREIGYQPLAKFFELTPRQRNALADLVERDEDNLRGVHLDRKVREDIERLWQMRCYRGIRHRASLPVRGQRTATNAKTARKLNRWLKKESGGRSS